MDQKELSKEVYKCVQANLSAHKTLQHLKEKLKLTIDEEKQVQVLYVDIKAMKQSQKIVSSFETTAHAQGNNSVLYKLIEGGLVYQDKKEADSCFIINGKAMVEIHKQVFFQVCEMCKINPDDKLVFADRIYNPHFPRIFDGNEGIKVFNKYLPPKWREDKYFDNADIPEGCIPTIIQEFLNHLIPDQASQEFTLDWLAHSLRDKNQTYLILLGVKGIGKNIFGLIAQKMHGLNTNSLETTSKTLNGEFNAEIEGKTLVCIDEIKLKDEMAIDKLKMFVNPQIRVEGKGSNSKNVDNFINLMIYSNREDGIKIEDENERRYSFVDIGSIPLVDNIEVLKGRGMSEFVSELTSDDNCFEFARYLYYREIRSNLEKPFRGENYQHILESQKPEWEIWLANNLQKRSGDIPIEEIQADIKQIHNIHVGRGKIKSAAGRSGGQFELLREGSGDRRWVVRIIQNSPELDSAGQLKKVA